MLVSLCFFSDFIILKLKFLGFINALVIGAACGPYKIIGSNHEFIPNLYFDETGKVVNNSYFAQTLKDGQYIVKPLDSSLISLLGNVFISEGKSGKVLKVEVKKRKEVENNFITIIRKILLEKFGKKAVSFGGAFLIKSGKAKLHIMPDFSKIPLNTDEDVNNWLNFFEFKSPLVCLTSFHTFDPNLDLRMEHTHCFSNHGQGGHYHCDVTPNQIEYEGYFNFAQTIYRVDCPKVTHNIGRD